MAKIVKISLKGEENIVGKRGNAGYQRVFKSSLPKNIKYTDCVVKGQ